MEPVLLCVKPMLMHGHWRACPVHLNACKLDYIFSPELLEWCIRGCIGPQSHHRFSIVLHHHSVSWIAEQYTTTKAINIKGYIHAHLKIHAQRQRTVIGDSERQQEEDSERANWQREQLLWTSQELLVVSRELYISKTAYFSVSHTHIMQLEWQGK
jgi:hypothetical protein